MLLETEWYDLRSVLLGLLTSLWNLFYWLRPVNSRAWIPLPNPQRPNRHESWRWGSCQSSLWGFRNEGLVETLGFILWVLWVFSRLAVRLICCSPPCLRVDMEGPNLLSALLSTGKAPWTWQLQILSCATGWQTWAMWVCVAVCFLFLPPSPAQRQERHKWRL